MHFAQGVQNILHFAKDAFAKIKVRPLQIALVDPSMSHGARSLAWFYSLITILCMLIAGEQDPTKTAETIAKMAADPDPVMQVRNRCPYDGRIECISLAR